MATKDHNIMLTLTATTCLGDIEMKPPTKRDSFTTQSKSAKVMWQSCKPGNETHR